jgi:hypothetical protein
VFSGFPYIFCASSEIVDAIDTATEDHESVHTGSEFDHGTGRDSAGVTIEDLQDAEIFEEPDRSPGDRNVHPTGCDDEGRDGTHTESFHSCISLTTFQCQLSTHQTGWMRGKCFFPLKAGTSSFTCSLGSLLCYLDSPCMICFNCIVLVRIVFDSSP